MKPAFLIFETPELLLLVPIIAAFALYIYCLADCIRNNQLTGTSKLLWLIIILIAPFIGSLIYLAIGRKGSGDATTQIFNNRMKFIYIILLTVVVAACKKSDTADSDIVDQFVKDVKAERYREFTLPAFNASHIEALMQHASDGQIVSHYPRPPHSSYLGPPMEVGFVMLYEIEAARLQVDWPSLFVRVFDEHDFERQVPLSEVLPYYKDW